MKLNHIEMCGFRGFRDKLRIDLGAGFTVISGRNGVGKSTICDAIEFAITGKINKYRVEKAAKETLEDYLWWRGDGAPAAHYVTAGFSGADGEPFLITRTRETGSSLSPEQIEDVLCEQGAKPDNALQQICRTSIIRDELIPTLSLDLTETERFDLVRAALGGIEGPDYASKAKEVASVTEGAQGRAEKDYEDARHRLNQALTELAEARDMALRAGDIASAIATVDSEVNVAPPSLAERIELARARLTQRRVRLNAMASAIQEAREIASLRSEIGSPTFHDRKSKALETASLSESACKNAEAQLAEARRQLVAEQEADELAAALELLLNCGSRLGLNHGHCPLCDAARTLAEFEAGMASARTRLDSLGAGVAAARARETEKEQELRDATTALQDAQARLAELAAHESALRDREAAHIDFFSQNDLDFKMAGDPDGLENEVLAERSRLVDLERAILTLEASQAIERVTDLESRAASLHQEVEAAADRLVKAQAALTAAKNMDRAVRRANAEIIDERLAAISPLLSELYERLKPHMDWRSIQYSIRGDVRRFLSLKVGDDLNPQFLFSSGQRRAAGLAFLLAVHLSRPWCRWRTLVLDDPVQHIDDFRSLHLIEVLAALRRADRQIICAVEDASLADLLCRRLLSTASSPGRRYDLDFGPDGIASVTNATEIPPMPPNVLRQASGMGAAS